MTITLYESSPSRSLRVSWTLGEIGQDYESIPGGKLIGSDELREVHPLAKLPAFIDDGRKLFESAAICTWLADSHPDAGLISASGTWERAQHDQWVAFTLSELEAYLWSSARNSFIYKEEDRVPAIFEQNAKEANRALKAFDDHFAETDFLINGAFSVTDIVAGFAVNWARRAKLTDGFENVQAYNQRLLERPLCPFATE